ncbi:MAG: hypothetical protein EB059_08960 [Alphaproteobacteria bacterium]|nr:hypothetical protein [Alphaproteobacteria bacterium]
MGTPHILDISNEKDMRTLITPSTPVDLEDRASVKVSCMQLVQALYTLIQKNHAKPAGLSAIQLGIPQQMFALHSHIKGKPVCLVFVNPELRIIGNDVADDWAGCFSIDFLRVRVPRPTKIRITANIFKVDGTTCASLGRQAWHMTDADALIVQHEVDHLKGVVTLDYVPATELRAFIATKGLWQDPQGHSVFNVPQAYRQQGRKTKMINEPLAQDQLDTLSSFLRLTWCRIPRPAFDPRRFFSNDVDYYL